MNTLKVLLFILFLPIILLYVICVQGFDNLYQEMSKREDSSDEQ